MFLAWLASRDLDRSLPLEIQQSTGRHVSMARQAHRGGQVKPFDTSDMLCCVHTRISPPPSRKLNSALEKCRACPGPPRELSLILSEEEAMESTRLKMGTSDNGL